MKDASHDEIESHLKRGGLPARETARLSLQ